LNYSTLHGPDHGQVVFPGGKLRVGEPPAIACIREVMEETGLLLINAKHKHIIKLIRIFSGQIINCYIYEATKYIGQLEKETKELTNIHFVNIKELPFGQMAPEIQAVYPGLFGENRYYYEINSTEKEININIKSELI
jgi:8-oxo-dGTP pyrophosphatase MutT (NUDIX family)